MVDAKPARERDAIQQHSTRSPTFWTCIGADCQWRANIENDAWEKHWKMACDHRRSQVLRCSPANCSYRREDVEWLCAALHTKRKLNFQFSDLHFRFVLTSMRMTFMIEYKDINECRQHTIKSMPYIFFSFGSVFCRIRLTADRFGAERNFRFRCNLLWRHSFELTEIARVAFLLWPMLYF